MEDNISVDEIIEKVDKNDKNFKFSPTGNTKKDLCSTLDLLLQVLKSQQDDMNKLKYILKLWKACGGFCIEKGFIMISMRGTPRSPDVLELSTINDVLLHFAETVKNMIK